MGVQGCEVRVQGGDNVLCTPLDVVESHGGDSAAAAKAMAGLAVKVPPPCKDYALPMSAFSGDVVGAKSRNTLALQDNLGGASARHTTPPYFVNRRVYCVAHGAHATARLQEAPPRLRFSARDPLLVLGKGYTRSSKFGISRRRRAAPTPSHWPFPAS